MSKKKDKKKDKNKRSFIDDISFAPVSIAYDEKKASEYNCYLSLVGAEAFRGENNSFWFDLDENTQKFFMLMATQCIDSAYSYKGKKKHERQLLEFPRGYQFMIPFEFRLLTFNLAYYHFCYNHFEKDIKTEKIDNTMITYSDREKVSVFKEEILKKYRKRTIPLTYMK